MSVVNSLVPSALKFAYTFGECPDSTNSRSPVSASQIAAVPSALVVARREPSGEK
jgi:hypothetical protein